MSDSKSIYIGYQKSIYVREVLKLHEWWSFDQFLMPSLSSSHKRTFSKCFSFNCRHIYLSLFFRQFFASILNFPIPRGFDKLSLAYFNELASMFYFDESNNFGDLMMFVPRLA